MYRTCLHCHGALGANDTVEAMPVGRRLAFDARRGRLWIVCPRCARWNLTPLEERWEAIEQGERMFRAARQRVSTDNVGLARVASGVELVRIGEPRRPELAAWRYGPVLERRRRVTGGIMVAGTAACWGVGALGQYGLAAGATLATTAFSGLGVVGLGGALVLLRNRRWRPRLLLPDGAVRRLKLRDWGNVRLEPDGTGWALAWRDAKRDAVLRGPDGERALRSVISTANGGGGRPDDVASAVELIDASGGPERFLVRAARAARQEQAQALTMLPTDLRVAIEMALHDETERRALEGELAALEAEWRLAEEIASIADDLLLPEHVRTRLASVQPEEAS